MRWTGPSIALLLGIIAMCAPVLASAPTAAIPAVDLARARELANDPQGAVADLQAYIDANPGDLTAGRLLGDLYFRLPDLDGAEAAWKRVVARDPDDRITHERLGALYVAESRLPDAIAEYQAALPLRAALIALVALHRRQGDLGSFLVTYETGVEEQPFDPVSLSLYANVLQATHHEREALPYYARLVRLGSTQCESLISRASDFIDLHLYNEAIADLKACIAAQPGSYEAYTDLGSVEVDLGRYESARRHLQQALTIDPEGADALIDLGFLNDLTGDHQAAVRAYESAVASDPLRPEGYIDLGVDFVREHFYSAAEDILTAGLRAVPSSGRLHLLLGETYRRERRFAPAREQFVAATHSDEQDVTKLARESLTDLTHEQRS